MTKPPPLHFGWRLKQSLFAKLFGISLGEPVYLQGEGLIAHLAIIAQSGSGKSFMLGRMLEEIAAKTRARFLILDPNSDFVKFGAVDAGVWDRLKEKFRTDDKGNYLEDDAPASFARRWQHVGFTVLTEGDPGNLRGALPNATLSAISLSWPDLSEDRQQDYLGISAHLNPAEYAAFKVVLHTVKQNRPLIERQGIKNPEALKRFEEAARALWHAEAYNRSLTAPDEWPGKAFSKSIGIVSAQAALSLYGRIHQLLELGFWDSEATKPIQQHVADLGLSERVVCIDLGSLRSQEHGLLAAAAAIDSIWLKSREQWTKALGMPRDDDPRCPTFVVIDEAHNLAPAAPVPDSARPVSEALVRIAMEGRKFGVFLILVTQRPSRLNENLLSQCDSLCLMKMSNPADVELVQERFGFVPRGEAARALTFKQGQVLLAGALVERAICADVAPRRTIEGGRSLRKAAWLVDPTPGP
jgi:hypothetical protein